jgi:hypothetical protein
MTESELQIEPTNSDILFVIGKILSHLGKRDLFGVPEPSILSSANDG